MVVVEDAPKFKTMVVAKKDVMRLVAKIVTAYDKDKDNDDFLLIDVNDIKGCLISSQIM